MEIKRGDIYYIKEDPYTNTVGSEMWPDRAGLVVSNNGLCKTSRTLTIVWLSTAKRKIFTPTHVEVISGNKKAIAICEHPESADISRFGKKFGHISEKELEEVDKALMFGLQLNTGINPQGIFKKWERYCNKYEIKPDIIDRPNIKKYKKRPPRLVYTYPYKMDITNTKQAKITINTMCKNCPIQSTCTNDSHCINIKNEIEKHYKIHN